MAEDLTWDVALAHPADQVFSALVRAVTAHGRLHSIDGFGSAVTCSMTRSSNPAGLLRASVIPDGDHALVLVSPAHGLGSPRDLTLELAAAEILIERLRDQLGDTHPAPRAMTPDLG
ncbi:MAG: hypothetical protein JOZ82_06040 [Marmoricola sp.]|nr:hypothetical protein [Marmoricola sp.]